MRVDTQIFSILFFLLALVAAAIYFESSLGILIFGVLTVMFLLVYIWCIGVQYENSKREFLLRDFEAKEYWPIVKENPTILTKGNGKVGFE